MSWPFESWLRITVMQLGLPPSEFWSLTLKDWRTLTQSQAVEPLPRDVFDNLRDAYPDGGTHET